MPFGRFKKKKESTALILEGRFDAEYIFDNWSDSNKWLFSFGQLILIANVAKRYGDKHVLRDCSKFALPRCNSFSRYFQVYNLAPLKSPERIRAWRGMVSSNMSIVQRKWISNRMYHRKS